MEENGIRSPVPTPLIQPRFQEGCSTSRATWALGFGSARAGGDGTELEEASGGGAFADSPGRNQYRRVSLPNECLSSRNADENPDAPPAPRRKRERTTLTYTPQSGIPTFHGRRIQPELKQAVGLSYCGYWIWKKCVRPQRDLFERRTLRSPWTGTSSSRRTAFPSTCDTATGSAGSSSGGSFLRTRYFLWTSSPLSSSAQGARTPCRERPWFGPRAQCVGKH